MRAGCLPRLIGINCARLQSRTESLTLAASQHFFLIVLMITTRADDHCGVLIVWRAALRLLPVGLRAGLSPSLSPSALRSDAPQGGLGVLQEGLEWSHAARAPPQGEHCPSTCKTVWQGDGKGREGDSSSCPMLWLCPVGEGAHGAPWESVFPPVRGTHQEGECVPHPETLLVSPVMPCGGCALTEALGHSCSHGCAQVPSSSSHSHGLPGSRRRGWGCCPGEPGERRANTSPEQQSLLLTADE